jgi:hypothetical protein
MGLGPSGGGDKAAVVWDEGMGLGPSGGGDKAAVV